MTCSPEGCSAVLSEGEGTEGQSLRRRNRLSTYPPRVDQAGYAWERGKARAVSKPSASARQAVLCPPPCHAPCPGRPSMSFIRYLPVSGSRKMRWMAVSRPPSRTATSNAGRSEEHTSELQSLMRISYAVFILKKKTQKKIKTKTNTQN